MGAGIGSVEWLQGLVRHAGILEQLTRDRLADQALPIAERVHRDLAALVSAVEGMADQANRQAPEDVPADLGALETLHQQAERLCHAILGTHREACARRPVDHARVAFWAAVWQTAHATVQALEDGGETATP